MGEKKFESPFVTHDIAGISRDVGDLGRQKRLLVQIHARV
jgi:hypothetical protein